MNSGNWEKLDLAQLPSPCFVVDAALLRRNLERLAGVQTRAGCKILLALKGFAMFATFPLCRRYLAGCCASGVHEARLAREEFGGEVETFAPAFSDADFAEILTLSDTVVFNSFSQWKHFRDRLGGLSGRRCGTPLWEKGHLAPSSGESSTSPSVRPEEWAGRPLSQAGRPPALPFGDRQDARQPQESHPVRFGMRVNPEFSEVGVALYNPCAPHSRLGVTRAEFEPAELDGISGLHFHCLCEQNADALEHTLAAFEEKFGEFLPRLQWVNFGGGHHITRADYDVDRLVRIIRGFRERHPHLGEVYLEPGEAVGLNTGVLVSTVLDVIRNGMDIAILDTSAECHMPDVLAMPYRPAIIGAGHPGEKPHTYRLGGPTCLAGDIIGDFSFDRPLRRGDKLVFLDMAHYSMVKTTTFNGINLPAIVLWDSAAPETSPRIVRTFGYADYRGRL